MTAVWNWLITPPETHHVLDPFGAVYFVVFALGFVISSYLSGPAAENITQDPIIFAGMRRWSTVGLAVFGSGLFFFGVRALQINPFWFGAPVWMVGSGVVLLVVAIRCLEWWRTEYVAGHYDARTPRSD